jgi:hypothetical protein
MKKVVTIDGNIRRQSHGGEHRTKSKIETILRIMGQKTTEALDPLQRTHVPLK